MNHKRRALRQQSDSRSRPSSEIRPKKVICKPADDAAAKSRQASSRLNNAENEGPKYGVDALDQLRRENMHTEERGKKRSKERGRDIDKRRRDTIAKLYAIALFLRNDSAEWKKLCDKDYWENAQKKPSPSKPEEALRHTIHYFHQSNGDKKAQKQSSKHFKLLEPFFEQGSPRSEVRSALKSGVENLRRAASAGSINGCKPQVQFNISEKNFVKLKAGVVIRIRLEMTATSGRRATAKIVQQSFKVISE